MMRALIGGLGSVYINTTAVTTPQAGHRFIAIQALNDITLNSTNCNCTTLTSAPLSEGQIVYGVFSSVTLSTAGSIAIGYHGV